MDIRLDQIQRNTSGICKIFPLQTAKKLSKLAETARKSQTQ